MNGPVLYNLHNHRLMYRIKGLLSYLFWPNIKLYETIFTQIIFFQQTVGCGLKKIKRHINWKDIILPQLKYKPNKNGKQNFCFSQNVYWTIIFGHQ